MLESNNHRIPGIYPQNPVTFMRLLELEADIVLEIVSIVSVLGL